MTVPFRPLAERMRPRSVSEIVGQQHLLGEGKPLRIALESNTTHSMIFWGPPGCGKTTLAKIAANQSEAEFIALSAVLSGVADIRTAIKQAELNQQMQRRTVLFVDEVHRFNKAQQDAFLPHVESGLIIFIGATTENPAFEVNNALLSRVKVYVLKALGPAELKPLLETALADVEKGLGDLSLKMTDDVLTQLAVAADGDARKALNLLELAAQIGDQQEITEETVAALAGDGVRRFDKGGDVFYDQISALHKSVRSSNPDAALYWLCRMLDGGCDPRYIARRVARIASEDLGNADPRALRIALDAWEFYERLGSPEGELAIAQAVVYLASAPKSNAVYKAFSAAMSAARSSGSLEVPVHLRNAPTRLAKQLGHGKDYQYDHDHSDGVALTQNCFPDQLGEQAFYHPVDRGLEIKIKARLDALRAQRQSK